MVIRAPMSSERKKINPNLKFLASPLKPGFLNSAPIFAILIGIVATLIVVAVVIVIVLRSRGHSGEDKRLPGISKPPSEHETLTVPLKKSLDDIDGDDKNPDVVPHSSGIIVYMNPRLDA